MLHLQLPCTDFSVEIVLMCTLSHCAHCTRGPSSHLCSDRFNAAVAPTPRGRDQGLQPLRKSCLMRDEVPICWAFRACPYPSRRLSSFPYAATLLGTQSLPASVSPLSSFL